MLVKAKFEVGGRHLLERNQFPDFLRSVQSAGYKIVGPTVRDGAIVYGDIASEKDLPIGWTDRQEAGQYRLERRSDQALFGYNVGPHSWKKYLYPAHERLWTAKKTPESFEVKPEPVDGPKLAFLGVRACELAAIGIQDRVFLGPFPDPGYQARRARSLRIAVQCSQSGRTCFCVSMGTGPHVRMGHDLSLTEVCRPDRHFFIVEIGSETGSSVLGDLALPKATPEAVAEAGAVVDRTAQSMGRQLTTVGLRELLLDHPDHPRWELVAKRCLSCTNCTLACPTCFCSTTEEVPHLSGQSVERWRRWDSCFNSSFTELHGVPVRKTGMSRYRQWMTHKLSTWHDQFGTSGCVGCGRCITWCPVGIDITEEAAAIRADPTATKSTETHA